MQILFLITIFVSFTHTLFGAGVLTFGTPIMLAMGYSFNLISAYLLPISFIVSLKIAIKDREVLKGSPIIRYFFVYTLPMVIIFSYFSFISKSPAILKLLVASFLIIVGISRLTPRYHALFSRLVARFGIYSYPVLGVIHGYTNMGGALLIPLIGGHNLDKVKSRAIFSFFFALFALVQMITLFVVQKQGFPIEVIFLVMAGLGSSYLAEKYLFKKLQNVLYFHLLTGLMLLNAVILAIQYFFF